MKRIVSTVIAVLLLLGCSTCKKFLDITPQYEFTSALALSSLDGLNKTVTGGFNQMQSANLYGGGIISNSELMGDFVSADAIADYSLTQFRTRQLDANNSQSGGMWSDAYRAIYIANVVLQNLPQFASQNPGLVQQLKGECFFIRGVMHFELLRMFAQPSGFTPNDSHLGIPLLLQPGTLTTGQSTPRSTVAQCYAQIEQDLDSAVALLPSGVPSGAQFVSAVSAEAFLTRVYFEQHNYAQALTYANLVINTTGVALNDSVSTIYNTAGTTWTPETLFQNINSGTDISNANVTGRFKWQVFQPAVLYGSDLFGQYAQADSAAGSKRFADLFERKRDGSTGPYKYWTTKYNYGSMNVTVIRLAEILLDRAECNAQLGNSDAAVRADYNATRVRAGLLPDNTTSGQAALLNAVRSERDMELAMEGDRFFEIKRRQIGFYAPESGQYFAWNSPQLVYPIPLQEVLQNKNMVQNPGY